MAEEAFVTYDEIVEHGEWLEDSGHCSRYASSWDSDGSTWVCHQCQTVLEEDPIEHECELPEFWC